LDIESGFDRLTDLTQRFTKQGFEIVINSPLRGQRLFQGRDRPLGQGLGRSGGLNYLIAPAL